MYIVKVITVVCILEMTVSRHTMRNPSGGWEREKIATSIRQHENVVEACIFEESTMRIITYYETN